MPRAFQTSVLTANDVLDGDVVWWTGADWSRDLDAALLYDDPDDVDEDETRLTKGDNAIIAIGVYRVAVQAGNGGVRPVTRREQIRADRAPTFAYLPDADIADAA